MKYRLKVFGTLGLIWLTFFELVRVLFLVYQFDLSSNLNVYELAMPLWLGLRMDLAMTAYWLIIPGFALAASFFVSDWVTQKIISISFYLLAFFTCLVVTADLELYHHWNFRMDTTPLLYVGSEGFGSVSILVVVKLILIFIVLIAGLHLAFKRFVGHKLFFMVGQLKSASIMFLVTALLFIPIRSSFRVAPLNTGVVYFHKTKSFPNHAGINVVWNFLHSVLSDNSFRYPNNFLDASTTQTVFSDLMRKSDSVNSILRGTKPNVLVIVLESFTSKIMEPLGGLPGITPNLNQLCSEGILFDNFYASGDRTDKGLISILSAYPSQPNTSIIKYPNKTQSLPALPRLLANNGYHTSFVYGGDIGFANMESYLNIAGFSHITEDDDFDLTLNTSKWGVHDQYVFDRLLNEMDTAKAPFFKMILSLSSHEPFDVPFGKNTGTDENSLFLNACSYTDSVLGNFIRQGKEKVWWKNTLIIITADHGHRIPLQSQVYERNKYKIPMLWLGGVLDSTKRVSKIGSQTDLAATLLPQLGIKQNEFMFSKDILAQETQSFAVYSFNNGFGYIDPSLEIIYDFDFKGYLKKDSASVTDLEKGKAFMQVLFNDYNKR